MYVRTYIRTGVRLFVCMHHTCDIRGGGGKYTHIPYVCLHVYVCMHACICMYVCTCMYVCACVCMYHIAGDLNTRGVG